MRANGKKIFNRMGLTHDIIDVVIECYRQNREQCHELAQALRGGSIRETCENIFNYIIDRVEYREDPRGVQWVKTPARLLADGVGDCKSMAILAASILSCLNINAVFRFVFLNGGGDYHHVYVIAEDNTVIDPVERVDGKPKFNWAQKPLKYRDIYLF